MADAGFLTSGAGQGVWGPPDPLSRG